MKTRYCTPAFRLQGDQLSRLATMEMAEFYEFVAFLIKVRKLAEAYKND